MKTILPFIILFTLFLTACGNNIDSIEAKNLKTPCDCAEAVEIILTEQLDVREESAGKDFKDIDTAKMLPRIRKYMAKNKEVMKICQGKLEVKKCPEWNSIKTKLMDREDKLNQNMQEKIMKEKVN